MIHTERHDSDEDIIRSFARHTPISADLEAMLVRRVVMKGDARAKEWLVKQYGLQIMNFAKRYQGQGLMLWDLFVEG